jgi:hypothetical protein
VCVCVCVCGCLGVCVCVCVYVCVSPRMLTLHSHKVAGLMTWESRDILQKIYRMRTLTITNQVKRIQRWWRLRMHVTAAGHFRRRAGAAHAPCYAAACRGRGLCYSPLCRRAGGALPAPPRTPATPQMPSITQSEDIENEIVMSLKGNVAAHLRLPGHIGTRECYSATCGLPGRARACYSACCTRHRWLSASHLKLQQLRQQGSGDAQPTVLVIEASAGASSA